MIPYTLFLVTGVDGFTPADVVVKLSSFFFGQWPIPGFCYYCLLFQSFWSDMEKFRVGCIKFKQSSACCICLARLNLDRLLLKMKCAKLINKSPLQCESCLPKMTRWDWILCECRESGTRLHWSYFLPIANAKNQALGCTDVTLCE